MADEVKVFISDREYTYEAMGEQMNLIEQDLRDGYYKRCASTPEKMINQFNLVSLHVRDGSIRECSCNPSKHLPTILGLSKDGIRNTDNKWHKEVLGAIRDDALKYKRRLDEGQLTSEEMCEFADWAEMAKEELNEMRKSWGVCIINTPDYVETLSGLAGEAVGFTEDEAEKKYMRSVRDTARSYAYRMASADISQAEADAIRAWAREQRRRLVGKIWTGELPKTSRKDEAEEFKNKKPDKKQILARAKKMDEEGKECKTCTTIPDKYKNNGNGSQKKDYEYVSVPIMGGDKKVKMEKLNDNQDFQWVVR